MRELPPNTLQHTATHFTKNTTINGPAYPIQGLRNSATHCNTLQHTATHCNILQHTATHFTKNTTLDGPAYPIQGGEDA